MPKLLPSLELVRELLDYDPDTGAFVWKGRQREFGGRRAGRRAIAGAVAGRFKDGYRRIEIGNHKYYAHRLAWFYVHGSWPTLIDHVNGNRSDNRLANLREADKSLNGLNGGAHLDNKCGLRGVSWYKDRKRWVAEIRWRKKKYCLGHFDSKEVAHAAYLTAASAFQNGWLLPRGVEFRWSA